MSDVKAIVGPRAHLKKAWREFNKKAHEDWGYEHYGSADSIWQNIQDLDEYKAMDKAIKNVAGDDDE